jgi:SAM-dependent methyltransferase
MTDSAGDLEISRIERAYKRRLERHFESRYGITEWSNVLRVEEMQHRMLRLLVREFGPSLKTHRILEVGCGSGYWLRQLVQWGALPANLFGIDLLPERIEQARELCPPGIHLERQDASKLSFSSGVFDLVLQATVFTSVLDRDMKKAIAGEMLRVLKANGHILWYDFFVNNPWNADVRGIPGKEIVQLFPGCRLHLERVTLAPPLGRVLAKISPLGYRTVSAMKIFCTHYIGLLEKT